MLPAFLPPSTGSLAQFDTLLPDRRVAAIELGLRARYPLMPESTSFATYVQPAHVLRHDDRADERLGEKAIFLVVTQHPKNEHLFIKSFAILPLDEWRAVERFANKNGKHRDEEIFGALARENYEQWKSANELIV